MLRNIPNKIDQVCSHDLLFILELMVPKAMLKEIVDETSLAKYDFMYLRIGESPTSPAHHLSLNCLSCDYEFLG